MNKKEYKSSLENFNAECLNHIYGSSSPGDNPYIDELIDEILDDPYQGEGSDFLAEALIDEFKDKHNINLLVYEDAEQDTIINNKEGHKDANYELTINPPVDKQPMIFGLKRYPISKVLKLVDPEEYEKAISAIANGAWDTTKCMCKEGSLPSEDEFYMTCGDNPKLVEHYKVLSEARDKLLAEHKGLGLSI